MTKLIGITCRTLVIGSLCVVALTWITSHNDYYMGGTYVAGNYFPIGAFSILLILILLINPLLKRMVPGNGLSSSELLVTW